MEPEVLSTPFWPPRTILVAIDGEADAALLVDRAATLALLTGARLVVVHAVCVSTNDAPNEVTGLLEVLEGLDVIAHARVAACVRRVASTGVAVSAVVRHGEPVRVLTEISRGERADLVVLGCGQRSPIVRRMLGDVRAALTALGTCGVLSLPTT